MGSGRPWKAASSGSRGFRGRLAACLGLVLLLGLGLASCAPAGSAFAGYRRQLDALLTRPEDREARDRLFPKALKAARTPTEWLSLLSRARKADLFGDAGRYEAVADAALAAGAKGGVGGADLARAAADAYLRAGKPGKVLALFGGPLSAAEDPELWAVALVRAAREGSLPTALEKPATYDRLATVLREPGRGVDAALLSLEEGDRLGAQARLRTALAKGVRVPVELQWDAGLYAELAARNDAKVTMEELRILADAAWVTGSAELAKARWARAVTTDPAASWRSYASLAASLGESLDDATSGDLAFLRTGSGQAGRSAQGRLAFVRQAKAEVAPPPPSRYAAMIAAYPKDTGARATWAAALARSGRSKEALGFLELSDEARKASATRDLALRLGVGSVLWPDARSVAEAVRLAGEEPDSPEAVSAALAVLLGSGAFADFLVVESRAEAARLSWEGQSFHSACAAILRNRLPEAADILGRAGTELPGPEVPWALASLAGAMGEAGSAVTAGAMGASGAASREEAFLEEALGRATLARDRCLIYKQLGRLAEGRGDMDAARRSWRAATAADPSDAEAARLSRQ